MPSAHLLERGPDNPNQMSVILPAQIGFDLRGSSHQGSSFTLLDSPCSVRVHVRFTFRVLRSGSDAPEGDINRT